MHCIDSLIHFYTRQKYPLHKIHRLLAYINQELATLNSLPTSNYLLETSCSVSRPFAIAISQSPPHIAGSGIILHLEHAHWSSVVNFKQSLRDFSLYDLQINYLLYPSHRPHVCRTDSLSLDSQDGAACKTTEDVYVRIPLCVVIAELIVHRDTFSTPLKVVVGAAKREFYIRKDEICASSDFLKAACNERWEGGQSNTVTLQEDDPVIFSIFCTWLSTGDIEDAEECLPVKTYSSRHMTKRFIQLARCFILGDALQSHQFCNYLIEIIIRDCKLHMRYFRTVAGTEEVEMVIIWPNTARDSPLRQVILDNFASNAAGECPESNLKHAGFAEFYQDMTRHLMKAIWKAETPKSPWLHNVCVYHQHPGHDAGYICT